MSDTELKKLYEEYLVFCKENNFTSFSFENFKLYYGPMNSFIEGEV